MRTRFLIIHNPVAGMRRRWMLRTVCQKLQEHGASFTIVPANDVETDRRLAQQAVQSDDYDAVVAAGGDSTVRGIASGLVGAKLPLGVIPIGTGNVLAHEIGIRRGPGEVARCLVEGPSISVRGARANQEPFYLMASAGFDARVLLRLDVKWKRRLGKFAYLWPIIRELMEPVRSFEATIDGATHRCSWLIVAKAQRYAGPFIVVRDQNLLSHGFHAIVVKTESRLGLIRAIVAIGLERLGQTEHVDVLPCHRVQIADEQDVTMQFDGEPFEAGQMELSLDDELLQLIVPEEFAARAQLQLAA